MTQKIKQDYQAGREVNSICSGGKHTHKNCTHTHKLSKANMTLGQTYVAVYSLRCY